MKKLIDYQIKQIKIPDNKMRFYIIQYNPIKSSCEYINLKQGEHSRTCFTCLHIKDREYKERKRKRENRTMTILLQIDVNNEEMVGGART